MGYIRSLKENGSTRVLTIIALCLIVYAVTCFSTVNVGGEKIYLFNPTRLNRWKWYDARVLGDHVIETEYGEIRLKHFCKITIGAAGADTGIGPEVFSSGKARNVNLITRTLEFYFLE